VKLPLVSAVGHVAIAVSDQAGAVVNATTLMGLREAERIGPRAYLTHGRCHHSLELVAAPVDALDHIGLEVAGPWALEELRARADRLGARVLRETPIDPMLPEGLVVEGPDGFVFELYRGMPDGEPPYAPTGVRPIRLGHATVHASDPQALADFLVEAFDFRVSDRFDPPSRVFLRCNVDHHAIAIAPGEMVGIHHCGWEARGIDHLADLGDLLDDHGRHLLWGPVRHGVGRNIAVYFAEPSGLVVEYYTDMERVYDEDGHVPGVWSPDDPRYYSFWARMRPEGFRKLGLPLIPWGDERIPGRAGPAQPATRSR
jgi:catechol 2,3-dioxygenase